MPINNSVGTLVLISTRKEIYTIDDIDGSKVVAGSVNAYLPNRLTEWSSTEIISGAGIGIENLQLTYINTAGSYNNSSVIGGGAHGDFTDTVTEL